MDRTEATGLGVAVAGHGLLLALLVAGLATVTRPPPLMQTPIEVSFAEDVALTSAAPAAEAPAPRVAPELGPPEDAAPAPEPAPAPPAEPEPAPPAPAPPQKPAPRPGPAPEPPAPKAAPAPERPARRPEPRPAPKQATPAPERPRPQQPARPAARPAQTRTADARPAPARPAPARPAPARGGSGEAERPRGSRLGADLLKGIGSDPSPAREARPSGVVMNGRAATNIGSAIARQVQPCADRQIIPGPGAERISTEIILRLNRDGSMAAPPRVGRQTGLDDENRRYADRVADLAKRSFVECAPLRGLPDELYDVPNGWRNFTLRFRLPD